MSKVKITLVKSTVGRPLKQRLTVKALGIKKLNRSVQLDFTPQIQGMVNKVQHLLYVEELKE